MSNQHRAPLAPPQVALTGLIWFAAIIIQFAAVGWAQDEPLTGYILAAAAAGLFVWAARRPRMGR
jgi:hypothetical protein